jgi:hypothetical protein
MVVEELKQGELQEAPKSLQEVCGVVPVEPPVSKSFWRRNSKTTTAAESEDDQLEEEEGEEGDDDAFAEVLQGWAEKKSSSGFWQRRFFVLDAGVKAEVLERKTTALTTESATSDPALPFTPPPSLSVFF